eukprot:TCONS_00012918-protein
MKNKRKVFSLRLNKKKIKKIALTSFIYVSYQIINKKHPQKHPFSSRKWYICFIDSIISLILPIIAPLKFKFFNYIMYNHVIYALCFMHFWTCQSLSLKFLYCYFAVVRFIFSPCRGKPRCNRCSFSSNRKNCGGQTRKNRFLHLYKTDSARSSYSRHSIFN